MTQFGNTPGSLALYQCNDGYEIASDVSNTRTCGDDGQWSGVDITCAGIHVSSCVHNDTGSFDGCLQLCT